MIPAQATAAVEPAEAEEPAGAPEPSFEPEPPPVRPAVLPPARPVTRPGPTIIQSVKVVKPKVVK